MTATEELRSAAARLRCEHSFPVQPPHGSLANPGNCTDCGARWADRAPISERLRASLVAVLDEVADSVAQEGGIVQDSTTDAVLTLALAINGGGR